MFLLTDYADIHYQISTFIGYSLGLILNYLLSVTWVFKTKCLSNKPMKFGIFVVIGLIGMVINQGAMWLCTDLIGLYFMLSRLISAGIGYIWKFFARLYIFIGGNRSFPECFEVRRAGIELTRGRPMVGYAPI